MDDLELNKKLQVNEELFEKNWVIDFPYTRRTGKFLTLDALIFLIEKQMQSLNDEGLEAFALVIENEKIKRAKPRSLEIEPNSAA